MSNLFLYNLESNSLKTQHSIVHLVNEYTATLVNEYTATYSEHAGVLSLLTRTISTGLAMF